MAPVKKSTKNSLILTVVCFFSLSIFVHLGLFKNFDNQLLYFLQTITPFQLDPFFSLFTIIGSFWVINGVATIFLLLIKKYRLAFYFAFISFFLHLVEIGWKTIINQPPPPKELVRTFLPFSLPFSSANLPFTFPSGHSMRTVFITLILLSLSQKINQKRKRLFIKIVLVTFLFLTLYSRISLGEHWFSDVLGGVLLGYLGGGLLTPLTAFKKTPKGNG